MSVAFAASVLKEIPIYAYMRDYTLERNRTGVKHAERISRAVEDCSLTKLHVLVLPS